MLRLQHQSYIERPRSEVFEAAAIPENELEWDPDGPIWMKKLSDGPLGIGTRYQGKWKRFGELEWTFADFTRPERFAHDAESSLGRMVHYLSGQGRNFVGGSGPGGGVAEVEAACGVEGVFGEAGEVTGG